ncbi:MAG: ABC transporter ATP-binding protein [Nitriliruptorales bacterium]|nr:ABC transporter ATP-binding protein [Nitriliruptorales bacterium]
MSAAIEVRDLTRVFEGSKRRGRERDEVVALDHLDLVVDEGQVHGLLGPNGAGKTTLVKILSTVLLPTAGSASVLGRDVVRETRAVRPLIGIVFGGERGLYGRLTALDNLRYWAALHRLADAEGLRRAHELLDRVGLHERADDRVETFSRGMMQRLHLARGLVGDPPVLFLDEPTTGLDPIAALDFRRLVDELRGEGRTILLTTHDMVEAEAVCDRVALIDRGTLLAVEAPRTLATWIARYERIDVDGASEEVLAQVRGLPGVSAVNRREDGGARIETDADGATQQVLRTLVDHGITSVQTSLPNLTEVYVHLVGDRGLEV